MGASRTSNKDILDAILAQNTALTQLANAITGQQAQTQAQVTPVVEPNPEPEQDTPANSVNVPAGYHKRVLAKVQAKCNEDGEARIMYARHNLAGETKLAYCLASRWGKLKDNGLIGPVGHVTPE